LNVLKENSSWYHIQNVQLQIAADLTDREEHQQAANDIMKKAEEKLQPVKVLLFI
jgi:hypothetical protein